MKLVRMQELLIELEGKYSTLFAQKGKQGFERELQLVRQKLESVDNIRFQKDSDIVDKMMTTFHEEKCNSRIRKIMANTSYQYSMIFSHTPSFAEKIIWSLVVLLRRNSVQDRCWRSMKELNLGSQPW